MMTHQRVSLPQFDEVICPGINESETAAWSEHPRGLAEILWREYADHEIEGVSISAGALPMLGIGAFLWLIAKGKTRSVGAILAGFGLLFIGIEYLQTGMEGISWNLDAVGGNGFGWQWILAGIGILMSTVMQSSSAAAATTLVALHAGSLTFDQACAMIVGQSVGTAATSALVAIGAGLAVRRAALAHIVYNVTVGIIGIGGTAASSTHRSSARDNIDGATKEVRYVGIDPA
jgi:phosphate:Na+ symporter